MNPRDAERLLGGYATGTLTESERGALFAAALEDQALFDALADEEPLRELLADPAARAKLLAALEPKAVPFWRRPGAMTLAASLLVAVGAGLLLKRAKPEATPRRTPFVLPEEAPAPTSPPPADQAAPRAFRRMKKAPVPSQDAAPAAKAVPTQPPPPPPPPAPALAAPAPSAARESGRSQVVITSTTANVVEGVGTNDSTERLSKRPPSWTWSGKGDERRLTVRWGPGGFLYLIKRDPAGDRLVAPISVDRMPGDFSRSVFAAPEGDAAPLDLYMSPVPLSSFPPDGAMKPLRVWPERP